MDDLAHDSRPIHSLGRKRKADTDDCQPNDSSPDPSSSSDPILLDPAATPRLPASAPDPSSSPASWLLATCDRQPWRPSSPAPRTPVSCTSPVRKEGPSRPKRPRIEIPHSISASPRRLRRGRFSSYSHTVLSPRRHAPRTGRTGETRDTGIVSATEPGPNRGSLLRAATLTAVSHSSRSLPVSPVEALSPHIPPNQPPINRETLKELDLDAILRNPQLRHDLLFDPGLQFRPTSSRRKRDAADKYWLAVIRELEHGCTCTTLDASGRLATLHCLCHSLPLPESSPKPLVASAALGDLVTVRTRSRFQPLLAELLDILISIIQPAAAHSAGLYIPSDALHPQAQQTHAHVSLLRSVLDADLIQQEIDHGLFDPSGVFRVIGDIVRCHCAPMRDHAVDQMVALAESCAPGGTGTKADAVRAIRLCFEIMELMKLDVANHQLQTLRPYLVHTAAQYELKTFQESRQNGQLSLDLTRSWLQDARRALLAAPSVGSHDLIKAPLRIQIQVAVTRAIVDLIFNPPPSSSPSSACSPVSSISASAYPETLYLDHARLAALSTDAADFTALYMLLMLFRQLVHAAPAGASAVRSDELLKLKKEIWEIGPAHLGLCFVQGQGQTGRDKEKEGKDSRDKDEDLRRWQREMDDVVLQVAARASAARVQHPASGSSTAQAPMSSPSPSHVGHALPACNPDPQLTKLATSWAATHLRPDSPLGTLLRSRIRTQVQDAAIGIVVPSLRPSPTEDDAGAGAASGLEPLMPEIQHLAERIAKVVTIHLDVYGALYAQPGFL